MSVQIQEDDNGTKEKTIEEIDGIKKELPPEVAKQLNKVWEKILRDARTLCPVDTGTLKSTIRTMRTPKGLMSSGVGGSKDFIIFDRALVAGDSTVTKPTGEPCIYARWVHDGHVMRNGQFWAGVPFLANALDMNETELEAAIVPPNCDVP
mgnify:CR=1 FL=1